MKENTEIKAMLLKTDNTYENIILKQNGNLEYLQKLVGGYIDIVFIRSIFEEERNSGGFDIVINDEGLILDLPQNPWSHLITLGSRWQNTIFYGDIVMVDGQLP